MRIFKTISFCLLLLLSGQTMINCSNNDDSDNTEQSVTQSNILGKWYTDNKKPDKLEFLSSGKAGFTYYHFGTNGQDITETGNWFISGNTLKIHWDQADPGLENWSAEILTLTNSQLKWKEKIDGQFYTFSFHR